MKKIIFFLFFVLCIGSAQSQDFLKKFKIDAVCAPLGYVFGEKYLNTTSMNTDVNYQVSERISFHIGYSDGFNYYRNDDTKLSRLTGANLGLGYYITKPKDEVCSGALELRSKLGYNYIYGTDDFGTMYQIDLRIYTSKYSFAGLGFNHCFYENFGNKAAIYWLFGFRL